jgi:hypothetical protein
MSASVEILFDEIRVCETRIREASQRGADTTVLQEELRNLMSKFTAANGSLNEGRQILKG